MKGGLSNPFTTPHTRIKNTLEKLLDQKEHRRLTVFRLGALAGSLLTHSTLYQTTLDFVSLSLKKSSEADNNS
jgi:hypothetical protein